MINQMKDIQAVKVPATVSSNEIWDTNAYLTSTTIGVTSSTTKSVYLLMPDHTILFCPGRMIGGFSDNNRIEIHKTYTFNMINSHMKSAIDMMRNMKTAVNADATSDLSIIYNCLVERLAIMPELSRVSFTICREINVAGVNESVNRLYIADLGIVVAYKFDPSDCLHPDSHAYRQKHGRSNVEKVVSNSSSCNVVVDYIDNEGNTGERFVNIFGRIVAIQPTKDSTRSNGIYMSGHVMDENNRKVNLNDYQGDFNVIDKEFNLHTSREAAAGAIETIQQQEQLDIKKEAHEIDKHLRQELARIDAENRQNIANIEAENRRNLAKIKEDNEKAAAKLKRENDEANARLQEKLAIKANKQKIKAQKKADELKINTQKVDNEQKIKHTEVESAMDIRDRYYDSMFKKVKAEMELKKAEEENKLSLTQQVAKTIPAVATGVIGTMVAIKLFEGSNNFSSGMSSASRW